MRWRLFFHRSAGRRERARELQQYLDLTTEENIARGLRPDEARRAAHVKLGNRTRILEDIGELNPLHQLHGIWQDVRLGLRSFAKTPAVSLLMAVTLALGIGATTAIFSVMNVLLLRPIAGVGDQAHLASVERAQGQGIEDVFSYPDYRDLRERVQRLDLAAFRRTAFDVRLGGGASERLRGVLVTDNYFSVLGIRAQLGRLLTAADANAEVVVISDAYWTNRCGRDRDAVGKGVAINGHVFTIVGVTAPEFSGTFPGQIDAVWLPMAMQPIAMPRMSVGVFENRSSRWIQIVGRLRQGATRDAAAAEIETVDAALAREFPSGHVGRLTLMAGLGLASDDRAEMRGFLTVLIIGAGLLLFVACSNVGNLLLTRAETRRREMATRRALGAGPVRIARQLLVEGLLLACAGGGVGLWLAPRLIVTVGALSDSAYAIGAEGLAPDMRVLVFALVASVVVAVGFTIAPLWHARRTNLAAALKDGARGVAGRSTHLREALVVVQVALSVMLLVGAGLSLQTMERIRAIAPGYASDGVVLASYTLDLQGYSPASAARLFDTLATEMRRAPGVRAVSWATAIPPVAFGGRRSVFHVGEAPPQEQLQRREDELGVRADFAAVGPDFFQTMGIAIARGRGFLERDRADEAAVAVINETLAERLWPGQDAVGRYVEVPPYSGPVPGPMQVIGVAQDTRHRSLLSSARVPVVYLPFLQNPDTRATLALQSTAGAAALEPVIRQATAAIDANVAVASIQDLDQYVAATLWEQRTAAGLFGLFGVLALFFSTSGLYAIVSHAVATRTREMGIRLALGSSTGGLIWLVVWHSLRLAGIGAVVGVALALTFGGAVRTVIFDVNPRDVGTSAAALAVLLVASLAASLVPARRAATADPIRALRQD